MATPEQYAEWIVANKEKKGSPEFETVVKAYKLSRRPPVQEMREPEFETEAKRVLGPSTVGGMASEYGKGIVRGIAETGVSVGKGATSALFGPVVGGMMGQGIEALSRPSREPFTATPGPLGETMAGPFGEFTGSAIAPSLPGMVQSGAHLASRIPGVKPAAKAAYNFIDRLTPGGAERAVGRGLLNLAGDKSTQVMSALADPAVFVPKSIPTAAEAAAKAGSAEFSGAQRLAERRLPTAYSDIASVQENARRGAIQTFGKTPEKLDSAIAARSKEAKELYGQASKQVVDVDDALRELFQRPSMEAAAKRAAQIAKENNKAFMVSRETPEKIVEGLIVSESGKPFLREIIPATEAKMSIENLHYMKMAMDDLISTPERFGIGATEVRAIASTKSDFVKWMTSNSYLYKAARDAFASASKPINVMQVGQQLEKSLTAPLAAAERPGPFATSMREAPRTIEKATGSPRFRTLEQAVGKENTAAAEAVLADLSRSAQHEKLAQAGASRAKEIVGEHVPGLPATGPLNQLYMIFKTVFNRFGGKLGDTELQILSEVMRTPKETLRVMNNAAAREALAQTIVQPPVPMTLQQRLGTAAGATSTQPFNER